MPLLFNTLLRQEGVDPREVRLLRHQENNPDKTHTPYELWRDNPDAFDLYSAAQGEKNRSRLQAPVWASFVADGIGATMFTGLYAARFAGVGDIDRPRPTRTSVDRAGEYDWYELARDVRMSDLAGRLFIEWGDGARAWIQRADAQNKPVTELRAAFKEDEFPGFSNFLKSLSQIAMLPRSWVEPLRTTRGVYLLTCPRTKEQYVGSAHGVDGFWGRWQSYVTTGHGDNVGLKSRELSDYRVSILETVGNQLTPDDILALEGLWKAKLQSREMGLNKN